MTIHSLRAQRPSAASQADVLYVHGSTFGAGLSIFYPLDGRSWADALNDAGFTAWGFDFAGYGDAERYPRERATHLMHLEARRGLLYDAVNTFLLGSAS